MLWLAEFRRSSGNAIINEANADALFVYEQMSKDLKEGTMYLTACKKGITLTKLNCNDL